MENIGDENSKNIFVEEKIDDENFDVGDQKLDASADLYKPNLSGLPNEILLRILGISLTAT